MRLGNKSTRKRSLKKRCPFYENQIKMASDKTYNKIKSVID